MGQLQKCQFKKKIIKIPLIKDFKSLNLKILSPKKCFKLLTNFKPSKLNHNSTYLTNINNILDK